MGTEFVRPVTQYAIIGIIPIKKSTIVFLSTYPPRECGIATFTQDLLSYSQKLFDTRIICKVAAFNLTPLDTYKYPKEVKWEIDENSKSAHLKLVKIVNDKSHIKGVILQHEYGIFGGVEGEKILYFMQNCKKPILVTLHTVLPHPTPKMKDITSQIIKLANIVVVLTDNSKKIIEEIYPETRGKTYVIPHGIHPSTFAEPEIYKAKLELEEHTILSTFGLLNRGKGIEYVINALPNVIKKYPLIKYLVLGETHPVIRRREGEKYRIELLKLINKLGLQKHVKFYDQYLSLPDLFEFLKATDIYISSSINPNQAVSGTLSYALGAGRAVISTQFAQAKEIVTDNIGRLVPIKDSPALTEAVLDLLSDKDRLKKMHLNAYEKTRFMLWNNVSKKYFTLLEGSILPSIKLNHLYRMTDEFGLFQFASFSTPNKVHGYTLDDNARALILCSQLIKQKYSNKLKTLIDIYFSFIKKCQQKDGSFINYVNFNNKSDSDQNKVEDIEDSQSRALLALVEIMGNNTLDINIKDQAKEIFLLAIQKKSKLTHLRAIASRIKAFAHLIDILPDHQEFLLENIKNYADLLIDKLKKYSINSWIWFEDHLSYNNAMLSESLLIAGVIIKNDEYIKKGLSSLEFLISKTFSSDMYMPIGHSHWYKNKQKRSNFDQQPEDPASMISALIEAYKITKNSIYKNLANKCFSWFLGNNGLNKSLYDKKTGGCYDGLHPGRVNLNQGAESLVSYLISRVAIQTLNEN